MSSASIATRLGRLETLVLQGPDGDGDDFSVDIGGDPAIYRIDGQVVSEAEFARRCPGGGFVVDIGAEG